ncbi:MAG TPA: Appr-1-p processing protein [Sorangium sp.]|nr:Appr-1-p processing protein [Sorangium sp.]
MVCSPVPVTIILTALFDELAAAWQRHCGDIPGVEVVRGSILDVDCDAVVSPANSFGFMDGGIDRVYSEHFGPQLQRDVQRLILQRHGGELLVGQADIVATGDGAIPYLVVAPTMRVPTILRDSVNPYLAARAALRLVTSQRLTLLDGGAVKVPPDGFRLAFPGLGTGVGRVGANVCARQVARALRDVVLGEFTPPATWAEASERHQLLCGSHTRRLQHRGA